MTTYELPMSGTLPVLNMLRTVLFPGMHCATLLATSRAVAALQASVAHQEQPAVAVFAVRAGATSNPEAMDLYDIGSAARVMSLSRRRCCGRWVAELEAAVRVRSLGYVREDPFREVRFERVLDPPEERSVLDAVTSAIRSAVIEMNELFPRCMHTQRALHTVGDARLPEDFPGAVYDLLLHLRVPDRQRLLEVEPLSARLEASLAEIQARLALHKAARKSRHAHLH